MTKTQKKPEYLLGVVIDLCSKSFLFLGERGREDYIQCETPEHFIQVWNIVNDKLSSSQIEYADLAVVGE